MSKIPDPYEKRLSSRCWFSEEPIDDFNLSLSDPVWSSLPYEDDWFSYKPSWELSGDDSNTAFPGE